MNRRTLLACLALAPFAARGQQGFRAINPPQPPGAGDRIEVLEFFWYGCGHCYALEPDVAAWEPKLPKDVAFRRVPAVGSASQLESARLFYAIEAMGLLDKLHEKIFDAQHKDHRNLANARIRETWLQENGVAPNAYDEMSRSFSVVTKVDRAKQMMAAYKIDAVPRFIVHGRYLVAPEDVGRQAVLPTVDRLVATVRKG